MDTELVVDRYAAIDRGWKACLWASVVVAVELVRVAA
jgi:hypothetical protein